MWSTVVTLARGGMALLYGLRFSTSAVLSLTIIRERSRRLSLTPFVRRQCKPKLFEWPVKLVRLIAIIQNRMRFTSITSQVLPEHRFIPRNIFEHSTSVRHVGRSVRAVIIRGQVRKMPHWKESGQFWPKIPVIYSVALHPSLLSHCLGSRARWEIRLSHVDAILSSVRCLVKVLTVHDVFLGSHLRLTAIVSSQIHPQTNVNTSCQHGRTNVGRQCEYRDYPRLLSVADR